MRITASLSTVILAFVLTFAYVWFTDGFLVVHGFHSPSSQSILRAAGYDILGFVNKHGRFPRSTGELTAEERPQGGRSIVGTPEFRDSWLNTFRYETNTRSYRIYSVFPNGKQTPVELDGDLDRFPGGRLQIEQPTLREFLFESRHGETLFCVDLLVSLGAGFIAFLFVGRLIDARRSLIIVGGGLAVLIASAAIVSDFVVFWWLLLGSR